MTNSSLASYIKISPHKTVGRNNKIDTITIHYMAGDMTVQSCGNWFNKPSAKCSSNYGVDSKGNIGLYVEEKDRAWTSSSPSNDHRAVTIEVANQSDGKITNEALTSLIRLLTDICKRNGIPELRWRNDKSLVGQVDKQNMTVHRWFKATSCPGEYLLNLHDYIARQVNEGMVDLELERAISIVQNEANLQQETMEYLLKYKYGNDLVKKLAKSIREG